MKLQVVHSTSNCNDVSCPTIYRDEAGNYIIQGFKLQSAKKSSIKLPEGEDAVEVPAEFIEAFLEKQKA